MPAVLCQRKLYVLHNINFEISRVQYSTKNKKIKKNFLILRLKNSDFFLLKYFTTKYIRYFQVLVGMRDIQFVIHFLAFKININ